VLLQIVLLAVQFILVEPELLSGFVDQFVTSAARLHCVLPLQVELVTFLVQSFELLCRLVQFDLSGLGFSNFLLQLFALVSHFDGQLLNLEGQFFDFSFVSSAVFLKSQVVFFLLSGSQSPLLEFFLVPIHFQFELIHPFVCLEDHVLDVVQTVLLVSDALLQLFDFVLETARLALGDLLHVLFSLDFFVLGVDEGLGVN
jgi:hypothetical protein